MTDMVSKRRISGPPNAVATTACAFCEQALAVVYGIEPMIILKDICGANDRETEAVVRWMMDALVDAALRDRTGA